MRFFVLNKVEVLLILGWKTKAHFNSWGMSDGQKCLSLILTDYLDLKITVRGIIIEVLSNIFA